MGTSHLIRSAIPFTFLGLAFWSYQGSAQETLKAQPWADKNMVKNLVSISVDDNGDVYVSETARRKAADLDIRQHRDWIPNDVSFQDIEDKRTFYKEILSPQNSHVNQTWLIDHNQDGSHDWKDLSTLKDKIHLLRDKNNDGKADQVITYSDDLGDEVSGIAAGVLIHDGEVYTTIAPDVYKMKDNNQDGVYDERISIAHGFGMHIAYAGHDMHGLRVGPDGRIYWSIGDKGVSVVDQEGKRHHFPNQGAVMRCNPDGSDFKVFAYGLRNVQEIAFDQYGNMFGVDNDSDRSGEMERFVYITEDSDSGWRCNYQYRGPDYNPWMEEALWQPYHEGQAFYITPPIQNYVDGPTGFTFNPGTALSKSYENHFFLTMFPKKTIMSFQVKASGAGFKMVNSKSVYEGINLTGLCFGPEGKLWASDWGGGYPLNDNGGIWNFDVEAVYEHPMREDTSIWLKKNYNSLAPSELISGLNHADQRVRLKAQFELVKRSLVSELCNVSLSENSTQLGRIHAIWGLGQLLRQNDHLKIKETLLKLLEDQDTEIIAQCLKVIADCPSHQFEGDPLLPFLNTDHARINYFACKAIGRHPIQKYEALIENLDQLIKRTNTSDTFLRHGMILAMAGSLSELHLSELSQHPNLQLRLSAVVALRRQKSPKIRAFLKDQNELVATEAARAIYDDFSIFEAIPELSKTITRKMQSPALWRRVLNSQYREGGTHNTKALCQFILDTSRPTDQRIEAIEVLMNWLKPAWNDRVNGRHREPKQETLDDIKLEIQNQLPQMMSVSSTTLQSMLAKLSKLLNLKADPKTMFSWLQDPQRDLPTRVEALELLFNEKDFSQKAYDYAFQSKQPDLRSSAVCLLLQKDPPQAFSAAKFILSKGENKEKQKVIQTLATLEDKTSASMLTKALDKLMVGKLNPELTYELLQAADQRNFVEYRRKYNESQKKSLSELGPYTPLMYGGNEIKGQKIFNEHLSAQCIRCHSLGGVGSAVGPDLAGVANRLKKYELLESLLLPGNQIAKGFGITTISLKNGSIVAGSLYEENKTQMIIKTPDGKFNTVERINIASQSPAISMMPSMKGILSDLEIRDVMAYLSSLK